MLDLDVEALRAECVRFAGASLGWRSRAALIGDGKLSEFAQRAGAVAMALNAALDLHHQAYALVYDVPRDPSGEPRRELHPWCVCQEHDGMTGEERRPCATVRAIAKELGVEADGA